MYDRRVLNGIFLLLLGSGGADSKSALAFIAFMASSVRAQARTSARPAIAAGRILEMKAETYSFKPGNVQHEYEWRVWQQGEVAGGQDAGAQRRQPCHQPCRAPGVIFDLSSAAWRSSAARTFAGTNSGPRRPGPRRSYLGPAVLAC